MEYKQKQINLTVQMNNVITLKIVEKLTQATFEYSSLIIYLRLRINHSVNKH